MKGTQRVSVELVPRTIPVFRLESGKVYFVQTLFVYENAHLALVRCSEADAFTAGTGQGKAVLELISSMVEAVNLAADKAVEVLVVGAQREVTAGRRRLIVTRGDEFAGTDVEYAPEIAMPNPKVIDFVGFHDRHGIEYPPEVVAHPVVHIDTVVGVDVQMPLGIGCHVVQYPSFRRVHRGKVGMVFLVLVAVETVKFVVHHYPDEPCVVLLNGLYTVVVEASFGRHGSELVGSGFNRGEAGYRTDPKGDEEKQPVMFHKYLMFFNKR